MVINIACVAGARKGKGEGKSGARGKGKGSSIINTSMFSCCTAGLFLFFIL